jgi:hypothetical protein
MKQEYCFAAFMILLSMPAFAATAAPTILVGNVTPQPVEPGRDVTIEITLFNRLTTPIENFNVALESTAPVRLKSASKAPPPSLCEGCKDTLTYYISVDSTATSGTYPIYVTAAAGGTETKHKIDINVRGKPNLILSADPDSLRNITPDSQFRIVLVLDNIGSGQARQIRLQTDSKNFNVLGGSTRTLDELDAGDSSPILFEFITASTLQADSYSVPFTIMYLDEQGNQINSTQNLGARVVNRADVNIQTIKVVSAAGSSSITAGEPFTAIARLENIGPGDADAISAELECPFMPGKKAFLGQLKKDEDAPVVFDITTTKTGSFSCSLSVFYKDDTGSKQFTEAFEVSIASPNYAGTLFMLLAILAALAFVFRKRLSPHIARIRKRK